MELSDALRRRRMVRAFGADPVPPALVDRLIDLARRAPSAGHTQPWAFVVLEGAQTARLWDVTLPAGRRAGFRWQGLLDAPVVIVPLVSPAAYADRYAEPDKRATGLGALLFGLFGHEAAVRASLGVPQGWRALGAVALGWPAPDAPGRSAARPRPPLESVIHRGGWAGAGGGDA
jgi:nitroreductase